MNPRRLLAALSLLALVLTPAAALAADTGKELEDLERKLVAAIASGDLATYDQIVADDYVAFQATGTESTKAEILASYRSGSLHYTGLEIFDVRARVFGDTAVVSAKTRGMRREGDHDVPNRVRYIRVYAKRDGRWRAVTQMSAPVEPEPPGKAPTPHGSGG